jgi:uncharacterized membrane protein
MKTSLAITRIVSSVLVVALLALCLAWELWLAPLRPGGSWIALKALPLSLAVPGIVAGRRYTYQWCSLLVILYFVEGSTLAWSEGGIGQLLAAAETALSIALFAALVAYARAARAPAGAPRG